MGAAAGALARLAQQIRRLLQVEAELAKAEKKDRKLERDAEKQRKLEAAMAKERAARVSAPTLRLAFDAAQATAESGESERVWKFDFKHAIGIGQFGAHGQVHEPFDRTEFDALWGDDGLPSGENQ